MLAGSYGMRRNGNHGKKRWLPGPGGPGRAPCGLVAKADQSPPLPPARTRRRRAEGDGNAAPLDDDPRSRFPLFRDFVQGTFALQLYSPLVLPQHDLGCLCPAVQLRFNQKLSAIRSTVASHPPPLLLYSICWQPTGQGRMLSR